MFARIVTYTADPSPSYTAAPPLYLGEQGLHLVREKVLPRLRQFDGFEGAYFFVDRQSSKAISITLWESEEAMHRSEEVLRTLRAEIARALAANRVDVEHYEVSTRAGAIHERELVQQELRVARSIQQASLPKEVPTLEGWQIAPYYQPAREVVGGDFYDFFELEDGRLGVVVGDAPGKGVPAALMVSATCSMLRAVAQALGSSSPGRYWRGSTRCCWLASRPTRSSPASTPSSTLRVDASSTPTPDTTYPAAATNMQ